jgi:hypothetical protein
MLLSLKKSKSKKMKAYDLVDIIHNNIELFNAAHCQYLREHFNRFLQSEPDAVHITNIDKLIQQHQNEEPDLFSYKRWKDLILGTTRVHIQTAFRTFSYNNLSRNPALRRCSILFNFSRYGITEAKAIVNSNLNTAAAKLKGIDRQMKLSLLQNIDIRKINEIAKKWQNSETMLCLNKIIQAENSHEVAEIKSEYGEELTDACSKRLCFDLKQIMMTLAYNKELDHDAYTILRRQFSKLSRDKDIELTLAEIRNTLQQPIHTNLSHLKEIEKQKKEERKKHKFAKKWKTSEDTKTMSSVILDLESKERHARDALFLLQKTRFEYNNAKKLQHILKDKQTPTTLLAVNNIFEKFQSVCEFRLFQSYLQLHASNPQTIISGKFTLFLGYLKLVNRTKTHKTCVYTLALLDLIISEYNIPFLSEKSKASKANLLTEITSSIASGKPFHQLLTGPCAQEFLQKPHSNTTIQLMASIQLSLSVISEPDIIEALIKALQDIIDCGEEPAKLLQILITLNNKKKLNYPACVSLLSHKPYLNIATTKLNSDLNYRISNIVNNVIINQTIVNIFDSDDHCNVIDYADKNTLHTAMIKLEKKMHKRDYEQLKKNIYEVFHSRNNLPEDIATLSLCQKQAAIAALIQAKLLMCDISEKQSDYQSNCQAYWESVTGVPEDQIARDVIENTPKTVLTDIIDLNIRLAETQLMSINDSRYTINGINSAVTLRN